MKNYDKQIAQQVNMLNHLLECAGYLPSENDGFVIWNHQKKYGEMKIEGWPNNPFCIKWTETGVQP